ncbi:UBA domain-containing protein mud1-like [Gossypium australe]|uniref:UBA domain-containing protein mud1-like n=1 Tax=Gossypium australe TaxID=47621 RepID=A0A5B6UPG9_9ROSI|nr:UBA domain-containing protein mud1-like [Gossypium australe]
MRCFFYSGPHMKKNCLKISLFSAIRRNDEPKEAKPVEKMTSMINLMVLTPVKRNGWERLMFIDINIAGQKRSALVDTKALDLFKSEKAARKLGLSIKKPNKKINMVNSKEAPNVGVAQDVELQIVEWKVKEKFKVIQLDDYDFVGTKVLSSIQLVEDVSYQRNIDSIEWNATKAPPEILVAHEADMRPVESTIELPPSGKGPFQSYKQRGRETVGNLKPSSVNQKDSNMSKSKLGQVRAETSCQRNVPANVMVQVKRRWKPRRRFRRKGRPDCKTTREGAKSTREFQAKSS